MKLINNSIIETEDFLNNRVEALINLSDKFDYIMHHLPNDQESIMDLYGRMARIAHQIRPWDTWVLRTYPRMERMLHELYQWNQWQEKKTRIKKPVRKGKMAKNPVISKALKRWDDALTLSSYEER